MNSLTANITANAARIILVFARRFVALGCLSLMAVGSAQAQSSFQVRLGIQYKGGLYTVASTSVPTNDRVEVPVSPSGVLRVYARTVALGGSGQALIDLQIYESRNGQQAQLTSLTIPSYLDTENVADIKTLYGDVKIRAYLSDPSRAPVSAAPPLPQPNAAPSVTITRPVQTAPGQPLPPVSPSQDLPEPGYLKNSGSVPPAPTPAPGYGPAPSPQGSAVPQQNRAYPPAPAYEAYLAYQAKQGNPQLAPGAPVSGAYSPVPSQAAAPAATKSKKPKKKETTVMSLLFPPAAGVCHDLSVPRES